MNPQPTDNTSGKAAAPNLAPSQVHGTPTERVESNVAKADSDKAKGGDSNKAGTTTPVNTPPKKKRKSPEKPWKKPPDMPKRPLSAYNLFFQDEKNRLKAEKKKADEKKASQGKDGDEGEQAKPGGKRKHVAVSGIGFANLAKTVAAKWKSLDDATRSPYEERAAVDKARYDKEVGIWREKQKEKKQKEKEAKKQALLGSQFPRDPLSADIPPDAQSIASLSAIDNPNDWFHTGSDNNPHDYNVPPRMIQTMNDDPSRAYAAAPGSIMSPGAGYGRRGSYPHHNSPPTMSPLGESFAPQGQSHGFYNFHNTSSGMPMARGPTPAFPGTLNSYPYSNPHGGGPGGSNAPYQLSPRRSNPFMQNQGPGGQDMGRMDPYMQQSSTAPPLMAFPDLHDPLPFHEDPNQQAPPQQQQQHGAQRQVYPSQPSNPFHDSYPQGPRGPFHDSQYQQEHHNSQFQQQQSHAASMQQQQQQQQRHHQQHAPNQPNEFLDDSWMDYITRPQDGSDPSGSRKNFPGNT